MVLDYYIEFVLYTHRWRSCRRRRSPGAGGDSDEWFHDERKRDAAGSEASRCLRWVSVKRVLGQRWIVVGLGSCKEKRR